MDKNKTVTRGRTESTGSIIEFLTKRKREEVETQKINKKEDGTVDEEGNFKRSKLITRSPPQKEGEPHVNMERIEEFMKSVSSQLKDIKNDTESTKGNINVITGQMKKYGEDLRELKEEFIKKEMQWESDKGKLREEIKTLKTRVENQERNNKRNNIVMKGKNFDEKNLKQEIKTFLQEEIDVNTDIEDAYKVGKQEPKPIIIKFKSFDGKMEVLQQKKKLLQQQIYLDSDLTLEEQKIQAEIRKVARTEKDKGKRTRVGYQKIEIEGKKYKWCDDEGGSLKEIDNPDAKNSKN